MMPGSQKYTYPNTRKFVIAMAIGAFAFAWVWLPDAVGVEGIVADLALYLPVAVMWVWVASGLWRLKGSHTARD